MCAPRRPSVGRIAPVHRSRPVRRHRSHRLRGRVFRSLAVRLQYLAELHQRSRRRARGADLRSLDHPRRRPGPRDGLVPLARGGRPDLVDRRCARRRGRHRRRRVHRSLRCRPRNRLPLDVHLHRALRDLRGADRPTPVPISLRRPGGPLAGRARVVRRERGPRTRARRDGTDDRLADLGLGNRLRGIPVRLIVSGSGPRRVHLSPRMLNVLDLASIEAARKRIEGLVVRTPLVRLNVDDAPAEIYLKLENLQRTGSFKVRGAGNAIALLSSARRSRGVFTCSAGNMAQALAWHAKRLGIPCTAIVPDTAPATKLAAIRRFGATIVQLSWDEVWEIGVTRRYAPLEGWTFVHPFADPGMMAGNGTIGLELLEDLPDPDAVVIPYGGGGLTAGIASAVKALRPETKVFTVEPETGAPFAASFAAGSPQPIEYVKSFVDGAGGPVVLPKMWGIDSQLVDGALEASLDETAAAVRLLVQRARIVAEGAGGSAVAAALAGKAGTGRIVCVVSGGNIDTQVLGKILRGEVP